MSSPADTAGRPLAFELLDARIRAAVEAMAATDPNPADPFRGLYVSDDQALSLADAGAGDLFDARLEQAVDALGLDVMEAAILALCAAPQLSPRYGRLYAYLHDDVTRKLPSAGLIARLLAGDGVRPADVLACFGHDARLRRDGAVRLLDAATPTPLPERGVQVADRLAAFLLGADLDDREPAGRHRRVACPAHEPGRDATVAELRALLERDSRIPIVVCGPDAPILLARALGRGLLLAGAGRAGDQATMTDAALAAALERRELCFEGLDALEPGARRRVAAALASRSDRTLVCALDRDAAIALEDLTAIVVEAPLPAFAERRALWTSTAGVDDVGEVAAKFRLSAGQIADAAEVARQAAALHGAEHPDSADLDFGARQASSTRIGELAARLDPAFGWDDIVLPDRQLEVLHSISAYLRHRDLVLSEWGYERIVARNQGLKVLFAGESGTGKTLAAQVLARDLGLELFRIDLATVVSKYIGETEKNLDRIFDAAEGSNAILFFDEADALFGKRSEVRDAHDRYANIEVAYLLQKMEGYPGAVMLATNFRQNIDDAFLRRLDFVVDFPFPEAEDRERIWRLLLPSAAPVGEIDLTFLAQQFKLAGGAIRNCAVAAAFLAADDGGRIDMEHLVRAVALEYGKLGRLTLEADFDRFHEVIRSRGANGGEGP
jgi:hypothetical protein